jgi:hypothetical protein
MLCPHFSVFSPTFIFTASEVTSPNPTPEHDYVAARSACEPHCSSRMNRVFLEFRTHAAPAAGRFRCLKLGMIVVPTTFS